MRSDKLKIALEGLKGSVSTETDAAEFTSRYNRVQNTPESLAYSPIIFSAMRHFLIRLDCK